MLSAICLNLEGSKILSSIIGLINVFEVVNIHRGPKNGLTLECEARGC